MSIPKTFLIVGRSFSGLEAAINSRGDKFIVLKDTKVSRSGAKNSHQLPVDFSDAATLDQAVESLRGKIDGVVWTYENYVIPSAEICQQLGLPGLPLEAARKCTDKTLMRLAFAKASQSISPEFAELKTEADLLKFAAGHQYPLIIKPANLTKSLLVTKNHNHGELVNNYHKTMELIGSVYVRYAPGKTPKLLVEEFLDGPVHSVEAFVDSAGSAYVLEQVVDYQTGYDIGYDDNFHYSRLLPSKLPQEKRQALRQAAKLGVEALGMRSTPAHVEIIYTEKGPKIVEIGARNGGYRERMHRLANGIELTDIRLGLSLGKTPEIKADKNDPCAVMELFPKQPGIFLGIANEDKLRQLESLAYFALKQPVGQMVGKSSDGYKMCAIIILHSKNKDQFQKDLDFVNTRVFVQTKPA